MTRTYSTTNPEAIRAFAVEAARLAADLKCSDVVVLDVRGHSPVCEYVVIASGTSQRQMKSVATQIGDLGDAMGMSAYRTNRDDGTTWIVVDCIEVLVHLFEPDQRLYYDLELMWAQAGRVDWRRDDAPTTQRAPARQDAAADDDAEEGDDEGDEAPKATTTKKPAAKKPAAKKPASKQSASKKPATKKSATKPTATKPTATKKSATTKRSRPTSDE
jgi:ribosome-associated protein